VERGLTLRRRALLLLALVVTASAVGAAGSARAGSPIRTWAYYYIWYQATSWNRAKTDYPQLGRYSSDEPSVMRTQIRLAKQAGIDGFIVSWKSTPTLNRRLAQLAQLAAREHFHLSVIYQGLNFERRPLPVTRIGRDLGYFARRFAPMAAFQGAGRPLVIWSGTWEFSARDLASVTSRYRDRLQILASERNPADYEAKAAAFDGDAYYWSSVNPDTFPGYVAKLTAMSRAVHRSGGRWIAPAAPGFDGRLVGHPTIVARRGGDTLRRELAAAQRSDPDAIGLISWNEFSENSQVEPSHRYGATALKVLADLNGTHLDLKGVEALDSSQPDRRTRGEGAIPAILTFTVVGLVAMYLLRRRKRSRAAD
jgi:glycosyl hydrolase family 99